MYDAERESWLRQLYKLENGKVDKYTGLLQGQEERSEGKDHPSVQSHAQTNILNSLRGSLLHISRTEVLK